MSEVQIHGYFDRDGDPCRVVATDYGDMRAELYRAGVGFIDTPLSGVMNEGVPISEPDFRVLIEEAVRLGQQEARG